MTETTKAPKVLAYVRVSTAEQATSGLGLSAQRAAIEAECSRRGWALTTTFSDEGVSGGVDPASRPGLSAALAALSRGDVLVVAKGDRLTRSLGQLCYMLDRAGREGWSLVAMDLGVDTSSPMGRAMAQIAGTFAELEKALIGQRTSDALQVLKAGGARLGRPRAMSGETTAVIVSMREQGGTLSGIAHHLNETGIATSRGGARWHASTVKAALRSHALDVEADRLRGAA